MALQTAVFILFNGQKVFHCVCVYHVFFINSSIDGHVGYFHIWTIVNDDAVNIEVCVYICFQISYLTFFE